MLWGDEIREEGKGIGFLYKVVGDESIWIVVFIFDFFLF